MESRYTRDCTRPDYDEKITAWLDEQDEGFDSIPYPIAIYHQGFIYRAINASGMGDYVSACEFLMELGLVNLLEATETFRGYDAVFSAVSEKIKLSKGEFRLDDIPRNTPN